MDNIAMARDTIAGLRAQLEAAQRPITDFDDRRLRPLLDAAHEAACEENHCDEYDQIMEAIGAPGRVRKFTIAVTVELTGNASRDENSARVKMNDALSYLIDNEYIADYDYISNNDVTKVEE